MKVLTQGSCLFLLALCFMGCNKKVSNKFQINLIIANNLGLQNGKALPINLKRVCNYFELEGDQENVYFPSVYVNRFDTIVAVDSMHPPISALNEFRGSLGLLSPLNLMEDFTENIPKMTIPLILSMKTSSIMDSIKIQNNYPNSIWINIKDTSTKYVHEITNQLSHGSEDITIIVYNPEIEKAPLKSVTSTKNKYSQNPSPNTTTHSKNNKRKQAVISESPESNDCYFNIVSFELVNGEIQWVTSSSNSDIKYSIMIATDRFFDNVTIKKTLNLDERTKFGKTVKDQEELKSIKQYANLYAKIRVTCGSKIEDSKVIGPFSNSCIANGDCILMYRN